MISSYPRLPRHCEEAMVIYLDAPGTQDARSRGPRDPSGNAAALSTSSCGPSSGFGGTLRRLSPRLHRDFGDSYFFFYVFGHNDLAVRTIGTVKMKKTRLYWIVSVGLLAVAGVQRVGDVAERRR